MKRKIFTIEEYDVEKQSDVQKIMVDLVKDGDVSLMIRLCYYHIPLTKSILNSIADTVKAVGKIYEFVVDIVLETDQWKNVKTLRRTLNQYAISVELKVTEKTEFAQVQKYKKRFILEKIVIPCNDYRTLRAGYDIWKGTGLPVKAEGYELTLKEYQDFFEEWIHDANASWFEPFEDLICSMMTGMPSASCEHSSCMGRYISLDREGNVYFCVRKKENTKMYSMESKTSDLLYNEIYDNALNVAVSKRKQCMEECQMFGLCRGGCPLEEHSPEYCTVYIQKVAQIGAFIDKEIQTAFANIENPCLRQFYLSLIAYGFRMKS